MKIKIFLSLMAFTFFTSFAQQVNIPEYLEYDQALTDSLTEIIKSLELDGDFDVGDDGIEQISFAVIDLNSAKPKIGGVYMDNFIYPASVYKMYVAAEVLNQVSNGEYGLYDTYIVKSPNDVDRKKEIASDPRPLLFDGDTVTINYLIDLMITRSDNSASNCMIDIATRKRINETIHRYNWHGSEVTRKFLRRAFEDDEYKEIRGTVTSALHTADFFYLMYAEKLINPWVSRQLKTFFGRQLDRSKIASGLPPNAMYYHKTGWWSFWTNDVGLVEAGDSKYIISCFLPLREKDALPKFKIIADKVHNLIESRIKKRN